MKRGVRNNNPANIRHDGVMWQGEIKGGDKSFKTFREMPWGIRAIFHLINNYNQLYGLNTIEKIISRWAPPSENDTSGYIRYVAEACGLTPVQVISTKSHSVMIPIVSAMIRMECGQSVSQSDLKEGWRLFEIYSDGGTSTTSVAGTTSKGVSHTAVSGVGKGKIIVVVMGVMLLSACTRTIYVPKVSYHSVIDTVVEQVEDSATMRALFECDSLGRVRLRELDQAKGLLARQEVAFVDGELKVETRWKTKYVERMVETRDTVTEIRIQEVVREVRHVPRFFWWCFAVAVVAVGGWVLRFIGGLRRL